MLKAEKRLNLPSSNPFFFHLTWEKEETGFVPQMFQQNPDGIDSVAKGYVIEAEADLEEIKRGIEAERKEFLRSREVAR